MAPPIDYYNVVRVHSRLKMMPAMVAGFIDELWKIDDLCYAVAAD